MRVSDSLVEKLLASTGKFTDEQLEALRKQERSEKKPLQDVVVSSNTLSEKELTQLYAAEVDVPFVEFVARDLPREIVELIPERVARQHRAIAFQTGEDGVVFIAMEDPDDVPAISFLQKQLGKPVRVHLATTTTIQSALDLYNGDASNVGSEIEKVIAIQEKDDADEVVDKADVAEDSPI
nr:type II/IV secretion system protein [Candidatus Saccharibacteria bacterium]